jgi:hypothetical protein
MIQRIQTVFLLLSVIALGLFLWMPLINTFPALPGHPAGLKGWEIIHRFNGWLYFVNGIFTGTAIGLSIIGILLFKSREIQMLICWFAVVMIIAAVLFVYYEYRIYVWPGDVIFTSWNALAGVAILFQILAWFYIRKDEHTIKSLDRLR